MCIETEVQVRLQNEMAVLLGARARLRDLWLANNNPHILEAISKIGDRLKEVEGELEAIAEGQTLNQIVPVITLKTSQKRL